MTSTFDPPIPPFASLPLSPSGPKLNAWTLYPSTDELGTLNRLTPSLVRSAAASEIRSGHRIGLDWALDAQADLPFFGRAAFHQELIHKSPRVVNDDVWTFNTQSSSQWDGLRHFACQKTGLFYNGVTLRYIHAEGSTVNGIGKWSGQGIVGRGVLLDYHAWRLGHGVEVRKEDAFKTGSITVQELKEVAEWEGLEIKFGDILFIRSGYMASHRQMERSQLAELRKQLPPSFLGVEQSEDLLRWVWEHFSAVAGDQPSFECWPTQKDWSCHEVLLAGWGMPIGELFDLERLADHCAATNRYSFFLSSVPCNVPSGVASPPNAVAIF